MTRRTAPGAGHPVRRLAVAALAAATATAGAHAASPPPAAGHEGACQGHLASVDPATLEAPVALRPPFRRPPFRASAGRASAGRASAYVRQGRAALDVFDWVEAARAFHAALRDDGDDAAAAVGLARTFLALEAPAQARAWVSRAEERVAAGAVDDVTALHVALAARQLDAVEAAGRPEGPARHRDYLAALERHVEAFPADVEALLLRGHADRRPDAWGQASGPGSLAWYRRALDRAPARAGVHHFLVHALEAVGRHRDAWPHALRLAALEPGAPHAHHMVAHLAPALAAWEPARDALETADRLHRARFASGERTPRDDWHFGHNLRLLGAVRDHLGDRDGAGAAYREAFAVGYGGRRAGFYCAPWLTDRLRAQRFGEADAAARACAASDDPLARVIAAATRGEVALAAGRDTDAAAALEAARDARHELDEAARSASSEASFRFLAHATVAILEAKLALAGGDEAGGPLLVESARRLCAGPSVDAWATCRPRVEELAGFARRLGHGRLAATLETLLRATTAPAP